MQDRYFAVALDGLKALVEDRGENAKFPFDAVWGYVTEDVPGPRKPHQAKRLLDNGYLELTGGQAKAESEARAGSPTREYRPGPKFRMSSSKVQTKTRSTADALKALVAAMEGRGFLTTAGELANFYLALLASPLVILTGISGTGKSRLPRLFSELIGASFHSIPVKPQWDDNSDLFGYTSTLNRDAFVKGEVTTALENAMENLSKPSIVLLDEMNLAAVEHYFSDFLSVIETRVRSNDGIFTDTVPIDLPPLQAGTEDPYSSLRDLRIPSNLRVVGTANIDETTRSFSPKVLDRAHSIEFGDVDLTAFPIIDSVSDSPADGAFSQLAKGLVDLKNPLTVGEAYSTQRELFDHVAGLFEEIRLILEPAGLSFGYRPRDAACLYMWHWDHERLKGVLPRNTALDNCILQKVLPKIFGQSERLRQSLEILEQWLHGKSVRGFDADPERDFLQSADRVRRMRQQLDEDGVTTYWGV